MSELESGHPKPEGWDGMIAQVEAVIVPDLPYHEQIPAAKVAVAAVLELTGSELRGAYFPYGMSLAARLFADRLRAPEVRTRLASAAIGELLKLHDIKHPDADSSKGLYLDDLPLGPLPKHDYGEERLPLPERITTNMLAFLAANGEDQAGGIVFEHYLRTEWATQRLGAVSLSAALLVARNVLWRMYADQTKQHYTAIEPEDVLLSDVLDAAALERLDLRGPAFAGVKLTTNQLHSIGPNLVVIKKDGDVRVNRKAITAATGGARRTPVAQEPAKAAQAPRCPASSLEGLVARVALTVPGILTAAQNELTARGTA